MTHEDYIRDAEYWVDQRETLAKSVQDSYSFQRLVHLVQEIRDQRQLLNIAELRIQLTQLHALKPNTPEFTAAVKKYDQTMVEMDSELSVTKRIRRAVEEERRSLEDKVIENGPKIDVLEEIRWRPRDE